MMNSTAVVFPLTNMNTKRFYNHINKTNGCWLWTSSKNKDGYGVFTFNYKFWYAHRFSYFIHNKEYDPDKWVLHKCAISGCVNPAHLYQGTALENNRDTVKHGRYKNGFSIRTHCKWGHEFNKENTWYLKELGKNRRRCKVCARISSKTYYERKK